METEPAKLNIRFSGVNLEKGTIDAYDLATSVMATADTLRSIANNFPNTKNSDFKVDVSALRPGSFEVHLAISAKDILDYGVALVPLINSSTIDSVKEVVKIFRTLIDIKKFLKGEKANKVEINQNGSNPNAVIYNISGENMTINMPTYNVMQDKQTNERLKKVFSPMLKEGAEVDKIQIEDPDGKSSEKIEVNVEEAKYFERLEELQTIPTYKIRGIVTMMDRKTSNGKLSTADEKRANFEIDIDDLSKLNKVVDGLIDSMRGKTSIVIIGEAVLDLESNLKKIKIKDIEEDDKLF